MARDRLASLRGVLKRFTTPLLPDDYSVLVNPLWSTRELRGQIQEVRRDRDVVHLSIIPGWGVETDFHAGQYIGIGVEIDGRFVWRSYSLTNAPDPQARMLKITVRAVEKGKLSTHLVGSVRPGTTIRMLAPAGDFHLSEPVPSKIAFLAAGTGITPIISMVRTMAERKQLERCHTVLVYCVHDTDHLLFDQELTRLEQENPQLQVIRRITAREGRLTPQDYEQVIPDITARAIFACGPSRMLDDAHAWAEEHGVTITSERFTIDRASDAQGGVVTFGDRGNTHADGATTLLEAGEKSGVNLPFGCRMGVCHTCVRPLLEGHAHNLVTGETHEPGSRVRTCVCVAAGDLTIGV
ncbi:ferredoxin reductase [Corynebacterium ulcerans]|uniref:ferredoxin reductase n=1 Tax=Corynebacterium ulcerans TaxID=65058 RepID=UPI0018D62CC0|nr:ferredoxin reductase [Corynebacterium ulcerans]MBH5297090.1 ferredoxin reductase [Corynebacterium ulcerans]